MGLRLLVYSKTQMMKSVMRPTDAYGHHMYI